MKGLQIITSSEFPHGSAGANVLRLMAQGLVACGWRVDVLILRGFHTDDPKMASPRIG